MGTSSLRRAAQLRERSTVARDEAVANILASCDRSNDDAFRILGRQVLERVHRHVDLRVAQRPLELGGEEPFPTDLGQRLPARLRPVAGGGDDLRRALEAGPCGCDETDHELGLHARQRRCPGAESDRRGKRRTAH